MKISAAHPLNAQPTVWKNMVFVEMFTNGNGDRVLKFKTTGLRDPQNDKLITVIVPANEAITIAEAYGVPPTPSQPKPMKALEWDKPASIDGPIMWSARSHAKPNDAWRITVDDLGMFSIDESADGLLAEPSIHLPDDFPTLHEAKMWCQDCEYALQLNGKTHG